MKISVFNFYCEYFSKFRKPIYLISIDLSDQYKSEQVENLEIPVIYQIGQVALLKVNKKQIQALERADIKFTLLDQDITDNSYYLADIIILSKYDQIKSFPGTKSSINSVKAGWESSTKLKTPN